MLPFAQVKEAGELDVQLLNERRARQAAEAMYRDQKATMEKMAAESKASMEKLADRSAGELRQAKELLATSETKQVKEAMELRQARDALAVELKQAKEALQTASAAHAKEVARLLHQLREASEVRRTHVEEAAAAAAAVPTVCLVTESAFSISRLCTRVRGSFQRGMSELRSVVWLHDCVVTCVFCLSGAPAGHSE